MNILPVTSAAFNVTDNSYTLVATNFQESPASSPQYTGVGFVLGGYPSGSSLTPSTINGVNVEFIATFLTYSEPITLPYFIVQVSSGVTQNFFTSISIDGYGTLNTSSADTFGTDVGVTAWGWYVDPFNETTGTYSVTIV